MHVFNGRHMYKHELSMVQPFSQSFRMFQKEDGCNFLIFTELDYKVLIAFKTHGIINRTSSGKKNP